MNIHTWLSKRLRGDCHCSPGRSTYTYRRDSLQKDLGGDCHCKLGRNADTYRRVSLKDLGVTAAAALKGVHSHAYTYRRDSPKDIEVTAAADLQGPYRCCPSWVGNPPHWQTRSVASQYCWTLLQSLWPALFLSLCLFPALALLNKEFRCYKTKEG